MSNPESHVQAAVWSTIGHLPGIRIFRNNVGSARTEDGRFIRFGLCPGSSDLIGWTEYVIQPGDVGRTISVFTAIEIKTATGRATCQQRNFIDAVRRSGGIAGIARSSEQALQILSDYQPS